LPDVPSRGTTTFSDAIDAWSNYLGGQERLLLVKSTDRARKLLMQAFGLEQDERVGIPANTRRPLSEAVKKSGGKPLFIELDRDLNFVPETPGLDDVRLTWTQPVGGMPPAEQLPHTTLLIDYSYGLPAASADALPGAATIWGLHLSTMVGRSPEDGALIAFNDDALYQAAVALLTSDDLPDLNRALAQCHRLGGPDGIAARQMAVYQAAAEGQELAAGLPIASPRLSAALPFGLTLRIPDEADISTFISYIRNENVDLYWLPEVQPMFYVSYQVTRDRELTQRTAENLSRWIISPLGPDFVDDEITHAVLGPVKAAEYTGVRWYTDPERARWYNNLLLEWYGSEHDAYRMAFEGTSPAVREPEYASSTEAISFNAYIIEILFGRGVGNKGTNTNKRVEPGSLLHDRLNAPDTGKEMTPPNVATNPSPLAFPGLARNLNSR
jgi:hypothetical protein